MADDISYTRMGYKVEGMKYWVCSSCERAPPFSYVDFHTFKYHLTEELRQKLKIFNVKGRKEFPEVLKHCTDATFTVAKHSTYSFRNLMGTSKLGLKRKNRLVDPKSVDSVLNKKIVNTVRESGTGAKSSENNKAEENDTSRRIDTLKTESEDAQDMEIIKSTTISSDKPVQSQRVEKPNTATRSMVAQRTLKNQNTGPCVIFPGVPSDDVLTRKDETSIASTSTTSVLEVPSPKTIPTVRQTLQPDLVKSVALERPLTDSELTIKNTCKMDCGPKKRKRENDEEKETKEEFATLRETMEESMKQILCIKQKLTERKEILREEEAQMDQREFELTTRKALMKAASDAAEKEFNRVKAMEEDLKKKEAWVAMLNRREKAMLQGEAEAKARDLKLEEREKALQKEEAEMKVRDLKLSERNELVKAAADKLKKENESLRIREMIQGEMARNFELRTAALEIKLAEYQDMLTQQVKNAAKMKMELENSVKEVHDSLEHKQRQGDANPLKHE